MPLREIDYVDDRDCRVEAVFVGLDRGDETELPSGREVVLEVTLCSVTPEPTAGARAHQFPGSALEPGRVKIVVFGAGLDVSPRARYIDRPRGDGQSVSFTVVPDRPGPARVRIELVVDGEAVHLFDRTVVVTRKN
ncbi:hypothetical protein [Frigoriglobus tundricola]|uniref:Uncharacterized protein n=1 Tax=Frigoriglobus tundricola TaxID=2774151 RepID=A0A6M5YZZ3_9BACT|nr:hypothetical protein [Frigoriglobus tundricola]QJW98512.1 hypothetical protein FTUN_6102 [Frigoriglobus tundricola]